MTKEKLFAQYVADRHAVRAAVDAIAGPACDHPLSHAVAIEVFLVTLCALLAGLEDASARADLRAYAKAQIDAIDTISAKASLGAGRFGTA